jgi:class 3 adenylate cyclase
MIPDVAELTAAEFEALGVYDPGAAHAKQQLQLLEYLVDLGARPEDLVAYREGLPGLASVVAIRGGGQLTVTEAVGRAELSREKLLQVIRAAGFPEPGPDDRVISEQLVTLAAGLAAADAVFGEDAVLQLVRVMGSAMARLADAVVSAFLVNVEPPARGEDPVGLAVARANAEAVALIPTVNAGLDILLREHIVRARRTILGDAAEAGFETQRMCVGFVDLVGSTALALRLSAREFGTVLTTFEHIALDSVTARGGRVVKLIGDEVLYTAEDEASACNIALKLAETFTDHPVVPSVRAGVAGGEVLLRDGDVFGPVVNLAARAVEAAGAGEVIASVPVAAAGGFTTAPLNSYQLKGFDETIALARLIPRTT